MTYEEYLKTPEWQNKRMERLRLDDFRCCRCGQIHRIQVHHLSYERLGNEDVVNDLVTLCDDCHRYITKAPVLGSSHNKHIRCNSGWKIKDSMPITESAIIFRAYGELESDRERQVVLNEGKIHLCTAHLCGSDYFDDRSMYDDDANEGFKLAPYEDYQWNCDKSWDIFISGEIWYLQGLNKVIRKGQLCTLENGLKLIVAKDYTTWEGYQSSTKQEAQKLIELLGNCEQSAKDFLT